jgi:hypothetical protein
MTQDDFESRLLGQLSGSATTGSDVRTIADEIFRRDHQRVRVLAAFSLLFWLLFAAGMFLLAYGLNEFILSVRVSPYMANGTAFVTQEQLKFWSTNLIHHSLPFIIGSVAALPLAAISTLMVVFSSRQATLKRINISLTRISAQLNQGRGTGSSETGQPAQAPGREVSYRLESGFPVQLPMGGIAGKLIFSAVIAILFVGLAWVGYGYFASTNPWEGYPRLSPFQAIRWQQETVEVEVNGTWYRLRSVDDVPVDQIVAFSKSMGPGTWQKHFNEDLVELLTLMGHRPGSMATLQVEELNSPKVEVLSDMPMTSENRQAIWEKDLQQ